jgi:predicted amidohydrolase YtcJ
MDLYERGIPLIAHANGDAAAEQIILAVERAHAAYPGDHRPVMIHAQTVRADQLDRMKAVGMIPSFFSAHPYFWGDWHSDSVLGEERASRISPAASALERDMLFTIHNGAPVVPPDIMRLVWITVTRETRSGRILGPDQRISVMEALKATTINAAYQIFEEDTKGSLEPGKYADLVILGEDPLLADPDHLEDIEIVETVFRGRQSIIGDRPIRAEEQSRWVSRPRSESCWKSSFPSSWRG